MSQPYLGEIRIFSFDFPPKNWALCNGQTMSISQNSALFSLLGTTYGGNGISTFVLPDLRGRAAMFWGSGPGLTPRVIGENDGADTVTLLASQIPAHQHQLVGAGFGSAASNQKVAAPVANGMFGQSNQGAAYSTVLTPLQPMSPNAIVSTGGSQPHQNAQPRLAMSYCIALSGIFPSRN